MSTRVYFDMNKTSQMTLINTYQIFLPLWFYYQLSLSYTLMCTAHTKRFLLSPV